VTYRALALYATALALAALALLALLPAHMRSQALVTMSITLSAAVAIASVVTARRVGWRDRLGLAWITFGLSYVFLLSTTLLVGDTTRTATPALTPAIEWTRNSLTFGANLFSVIAFMLFARVWSGTGLVPEWRWLATLVSFAVTIIVAGRTTVNDLLLARSMHLDAIGNLLSDLGDIICFTIIGPVAATAVALRGGALVWPWTLLTISSVAWLIYDVGGYFGRAEQVAELSAVITADLFALVAALAQGMVARQAGAEGRRKRRLSRPG
jgi:hypothetical protein